MENGIHIYTGEIDEEDDSTEIRDLRVSTLLMWCMLSLVFCALVFRNLCLSPLLAAIHFWR